MKTYQVVRFGFGQDSTISRLYRIAKGKRTFLCYMIEDERRFTKVQGETCIPVGSYEVLLRREGGMHSRYIDRYGGKHKGMLWLQDVPGFQFIYVHPGNDDDDTEGCLLPGNVPQMDGEGEFRVGGSQDAYWPLYEEMVEALMVGEGVVIHVSEAQPLP